MKKHNLIICIILVLLAVLCIVFWQQRNAERENLEMLCRSSAGMALDHFKAYAESGIASDYISGVAEFRSFMNTYLFLKDNASAEYIWCNIVYGEMLLHPERVQKDLQGLLDALEYLAEDYDHPNGFNLMHVYSNSLRHESD